jgi:hypothetical protein
MAGTKHKMLQGKRQKRDHYQGSPHLSASCTLDAGKYTSPFCFDFYIFENPVQALGKWHAAQAASASSSVAPGITALRDLFPLPTTHIFDTAQTHEFSDRAFFEPWICDSLLTACSLNRQDGVDRQKNSNMWGQFYECPGSSVKHQVLDNFWWHHAGSDEARTFDSEDGSLLPSDYLNQLFKNEKEVAFLERRGHGGYLRVNGVQKGDLAILRRWLHRLTHESDRCIFGGNNHGREEQSKEIHSILIHAKDFAARWCLWNIRYGTLFRLKHNQPSGCDEKGVVQGWLGCRPPRKSTGGNAPRKRLRHDAGPGGE